MADPNPFTAELARRQAGATDNPFAAELQRRGEPTVAGTITAEATEERARHDFPLTGTTADNIFRAVQAFNQGMTLGFGDEINAALAAGLGVGDYGTNLEILREHNRAYRREHPVASIGLEAAGGVTSGLAAAPLAAGAAPAGTAVRAGGTAQQLARGGNIARAARLGAAGAAAGGVQGFGVGEGGLQNRLESAGWGAATGGVLGAGAGLLLPPIARAASSRIQQWLGDLKGVDPAQRRALEHIRDALAADQISVADARDELSRLGISTTVADVGGENVLSLARAAQSFRGRARDVGRRVLGGRQATQHARLADDIEDAFGGGAEFNMTRRDMLRGRAAAARPLYEAAYEEGVDFTPELQELFRRPAVSQAWRAAQNIAANEGETLPQIFVADDAGNLLLDLRNAPTMRTIDYIKRGLDDVVERSRDPITGKIVGDQARSVAAVRRRLLDLVDDANPAYAQARAAYAGQSASIDALDQGRRVANSIGSRRGDIRFDPDQLAEDLASMTEGEKAFFRQGLARGLLDIMESAPDNADAVRRIVGSEAKRGRLRAAFPDAQSFTRFMSAMQREAQFNRTYNEVLGGSPTARIAAEQRQMIAGGPEPPVPSLTEIPGRMVRSAVRTATAPPPGVADALEMMFAQGGGARRVLGQVAATERDVLPPAMRRAAVATLLSQPERLRRELERAY